MALTDSIIHYWKFDSSNSNDSIGSANGTDTSITYNGTNGKINNGAGFGSGSKIVFGTVSDLQFTSSGAFTMNFWFKGTFTNGAFASYYQGSSPYTGWTLYRNDAQAGTNGVYFYLNNGGSYNELKMSCSGTNLGGNPYDGNWHMITITYSGGNSISNMKFYLDGTVNSGTTNSVSATSSPSYSGLSFNIGAENGVAEINPGAIDEFGVWSRTLSAGEVTTLWNGGSGLTYPFTAYSFPALEMGHFA